MGFYRDIEFRLVRQLTQKHLTLATAESCTGGALANLITNVSGASKVFVGGVVPYSNQLKQKILNVDPRIIKKHGAVSEQCALAMVKGLRRLTKADICVAITGIAGPTGGTQKKPVGSVFVGFFCEGRVCVSRCVIRKSRTAFKNDVCRRVLRQLLGE